MTAGASALSRPVACVGGRQGELFDPVPPQDDNRAQPHVAQGDRVLLGQITELPHQQPSHKAALTRFYAGVRPAQSCQVQTAGRIIENKQSYIFKE